MGEQTGIAWTHHTFNPWWGCTRVSPGCEHCYAEAWAKRTGYADGGKHLPIWGVDAERRPMSDKHWGDPVRWNAKAAKAGERRRVFCASMADVFEIVPDRNSAAEAVMSAARKRLWALIGETPHLDWLLLTKRPENVPELAPYGSLRGWPRNVWLGTTCEDQQRADHRLPLLLRIPAQVRFVSYEPALGPVDWMPWLDWPGNHPRGFPRGIDWLIVGGESGAKARPFAQEWAERAVEVGADTSTPVFVKQMGDYMVSEYRTTPKELLAGTPRQHLLAPNGEVYTWRAGGLDPKGGNPDQWPEHLRIRQFPQVAW